MIPFRYKHTGSDLAASFDRSQHTPYETIPSPQQAPFLDPQIMKAHHNYLGSGVRDDRGVNRSIHAVQNNQHWKWIRYATSSSNS